MANNAIQTTIRGQRLGIGASGEIIAPGGIDPILPLRTTVAAAGSVQGDAAALQSGVQIVTGANGTLGVRLPVPEAGKSTMVIIKGTTSGVLKVWPNVGGTINTLTGDAAMSLASGLIPAIFISTSASQWYSIPLVPS
jgi:hypothetical protein